jgi:PPOX class probable F420-dependent enzyme
MDADLRAVLDGTPVAHLATVLPDGAPHSVPVWIGVVDDRVVLMTGPGSLKARNLRRDPRLAISLTREDDPFRSIVLRGRVGEWIEGDAAWAIVDGLAAKYIGSDYPRGDERVALFVDLDHEVLR